jgi:hypothetical protein
MNRPPATWEPTYRNNYLGYYQVGSTPKPPGARVQTMSFDLYTPDYFGSGEHLDFTLHGVHNFVASNIETSSRSGLGVMLGQTDLDRCGSAGAQIEAFWIGGGNNVTTCPTSRGPLLNNTWYHVTISVDDSAVISFAITGGNGPQPVISQTFNAANIYAKNGVAFPNSTGYWILPATLSTRDYTVYISNLNVYWH